MFVQLPNEILFAVMMGLADPADVANFALVCKRFSAVAADPYIRGRWQVARLGAGACLALYSKGRVDSFAAILALRDSADALDPETWLRCLAASAAASGREEYRARELVSILLDASVSPLKNFIALSQMHPALRALAELGHAAGLSRGLDRMGKMLGFNRARRAPDAFMLGPLAKTAIAREDYATLDVILSYRERFEPNRNKEYPIYAAFELGGSLEMIKFLLSRPASPPDAEPDTSPAVCSGLACRHGRLDVLLYLFEELGFDGVTPDQTWQAAKGDHVEVMRFVLERTELKVTRFLFSNCVSRVMFELLFTEFRHKWDLVKWGQNVLVGSVLVCRQPEKGWSLVRYMFGRLVEEGFATAEAALHAVNEGFRSMRGGLSRQGKEYARDFAEDLRGDWAGEMRESPEFAEALGRLSRHVVSSGGAEVLEILLEIPEFDPGAPLPGSCGPAAEGSFLQRAVAGQRPEVVAALLANPRVDPHEGEGLAVKAAFDWGRSRIQVWQSQLAADRVVATARAFADSPRVDLTLYGEDLARLIQVKSYGSMNHGGRVYSQLEQILEEAGIHVEPED